MPLLHATAAGRKIRIWVSLTAACRCDCIAAFCAKFITLLCLYLTLSAGVVCQNADLVSSSRQAIIETGFSPRYFDEHFTVLKVVAKTGDRRVVWKFSLHGYETLVTDSVGYYTGTDQARVYVHSVRNTMISSKDIINTIPKSRARRLMKACIGRYDNDAVVFARILPPETTSLYLTARATNNLNRHLEQKNAAQREKANNNLQSDEREKETFRHSPTLLGYINLETGNCTKGKGLASP